MHKSAQGKWQSTAWSTAQRKQQQMKESVYHPVDGLWYQRFNREQGYLSRCLAIDRAVGYNMEPVDRPIDRDAYFGRIFGSFLI